MAVEDSPFRPQEETTERTVDRPDTLDRFKKFLGDLFKPKEKSPEEDEDSEKRTEKRGRFARAWRRLFRGSVAQTETINDSNPKRGLFFELGGSENQREQADTATSVETAETAEVTVAETATEHPVMETESVAEPEQEHNTTPSNEGAQDMRLDTTEEPQQLYSRQEVTVAEQSTAPQTQTERPLVRTEIARIRRLEQRQQEAERKLRQALSNNAAVLRPRPEVAEKPLVVTAERAVPKPVEVVPQSVVRPEVLRTAKQSKAETVLERPEKQVPNQEVKPLTPEAVYPVSEEVKKVVERIEKGDVTEKAYELSHEHKDADITASAQVSAMQKTTEQTQTAAKAVLQAAQSPAKNDPKKSITQVEDPFTVYQQVAMKGFIAAAILFAIVMVLLLLK